MARAQKEWKLAELETRRGSSSRALPLQQLQELDCVGRPELHEHGYEAHQLAGRHVLLQLQLNQQIDGS
jgi:hypothetical protein